MDDLDQFNFEGSYSNSLLSIDDVEINVDANEIPKAPVIPDLGFTAVSLGLYGMLQGAWEASSTASKDAEVSLKMASTLHKRAQYRLMREQYRLMRAAKEKPYLRIARGSIVGGVQYGMFGAGFYAMLTMLAEKRGVHDVYNFAAASSASVAVMFGLIMSGSLAKRACVTLIAGDVAAPLGFPFGWLHLRLNEMRNEDLMDAYLKEKIVAKAERLQGNNE